VLLLLLLLLQLLQWGVLDLCVCVCVCACVCACEYKRECVCASLCMACELALFSWAERRHEQLQLARVACVCQCFFQGFGVCSIQVKRATQGALAKKACSASISQKTAKSCM